MTGTGRRLHRLAVEVGDLPRSAMITAAKTSKKIAQQEAARYSPLRLHRKGRPARAVKLRAVDEIRTSGGVTTCRVQGLPVGPWVWLNTGTRAHPIGAVAKGTRRRRGMQGPQRPGSGAKLHFGGRWSSGPIWHRGGTGKQLWRRTARRIARVVPEIYSDAVREAIRG